MLRWSSVFAEAGVKIEPYGIYRSSQPPLRPLASLLADEVIRWLAPSGRTSTRAGVALPAIATIAVYCSYRLHGSLPSADAWSDRLLVGCVENPARTQPLPGRCVPCVSDAHRPLAIRAGRAHPSQGHGTTVYERFWELAAEIDLGVASRRGRRESLRRPILNHEREAGCSGLHRAGRGAASGESLRTLGAARLPSKEGVPIHDERVPESCDCGNPTFSGRAAQVKDRAARSV